MAFWQTFTFLIPIWYKVISKTCYLSFIQYFYCIAPFASVCPVELFVLNCLPSIKTKKLNVRCAVPKPHDIVLRVTKTDVLLEPLKVFLVRNCKQSSQLRRNIKLSRNNARTFQKIKKCGKRSLSFYLLREHALKEHGA